MRTTIRIDEHLLREAKRLAAEQGTSLTRIIEDALQACLKRNVSGMPAAVSLPTFGTRGVHAGVNLDSSADLLQRMEEGS